MGFFPMMLESGIVYHATWNVHNRINTLLGDVMGDVFEQIRLLQVAKVRLALASNKSDFCFSLCCILFQIDCYPKKPCYIADVTQNR